MSLLTTALLSAAMAHPLEAAPKVDIEPPVSTGLALLVVGSIGVAGGLGTKIVGSVGWADDADFDETDTPNSADAPFYDAVGMSVAFASSAFLLGGAHLRGQHDAARELRTDGETWRHPQALIGTGFGLLGIGVVAVTAAQVGYWNGTSDHAAVGLEVGNYLGLAASVTGMTLAGYGLGRLKTERRAGVFYFSCAPQLGRRHVGLTVTGRF